MCTSISFMKIFNYILLILLISSCSLFEQRDKKRDIQSQILRSLNAKVPDFSKCANATEIFKKFDNKRVRVELNLTLNSKGQVENFQLDNKQYPDLFVECLFKTIDLIGFPKLEKDEVIELTQPMIFKKD